MAKIANFSEQEQALYQESLKVYRDNFNVTQTLIQESLQAGIKQGIEQGVQQVAQQMKGAGLSVQEIARFTGLSEAEIDEL